MTNHAPLPIVRRLLWVGWRGLFAWVVSMVAILGLYLPIYPSVNTPEMMQVINSMPEELVRGLGYEDVATGAGYTHASFFGLLGFVLVAIAATAWSSAYIAGADESGELELIFAHGISRRRYAAEVLITLGLKFGLLAVVVFAMTMAMNESYDLGLTAGNVWAEVIAWVALGALSAAAAFCAGGLVGRRAIAIGAGSAVAVVGYLADALGNVVERMDWLLPFSPFHWAYGQTPLTNGFDWPGLGLLFGCSLVLVVIGIVALNRRDVLG